MIQPPRQPFSEPWRTTVLRNGGLALLVGVIVGLVERRLALIPSTAVLALWFTFGGHFFEVLFRNRVLPLFTSGPAAPMLARLVYWFVSGVALYGGAMATRTLLTGQRTTPLSWWVAGIAFVGVELLVHLGLRARGLPCLYDGRG